MHCKNTHPCFLHKYGFFLACPMIYKFHMSAAFCRLVLLKYGENVELMGLCQTQMVCVYNRCSGRSHGFVPITDVL